MNKQRNIDYNKSLVKFLSGFEKHYKYLVKQDGKVKASDEMDKNLISYMATKVLILASQVRTFSSSELFPEQKKESITMLYNEIARLTKKVPQDYQVFSEISACVGRFCTVLGEVIKQPEKHIQTKGPLDSLKREKMIAERSLKYVEGGAHTLLVNANQAIDASTSEKMNKIILIMNNYIAASTFLNQYCCTLPGANKRINEIVKLARNNSATYSEMMDFGNILSKLEAVIRHRILQINEEIRRSPDI